MTGILDASAALEVSLNHKKAAGIITVLKRADWVIAPDLYVSEVADTFWKYHQFESLPLDICEQTLEKTIDLVDDFVHGYTLYKEAFGLACLAHHSVYDMMYLVLSRRENGVLITVDEKLLQLAAKYSIKTVTDAM